jgi:hypothetical protein
MNRRRRRELIPPPSILPRRFMHMLPPHTISLPFSNTIKQLRQQATSPPPFKMDSRDSLVYKAKLAEQAERFDEMVDHMKAVAQQPQELSVEERNLLSVAYKNVIGSRRASWRVISSIEQKGEQERLPLIREYKAKIEDELLEICNDILNIIETELIPNSTSEEGKVFYFKMKGDYHRYLAEFQVGQKADT